MKPIGSSSASLVRPGGYRVQRPFRNTRCKWQNSLSSMATERDYSHRTAIQKLGVRPDQRVEVAGDVGSGLRRDVKETLGRGLVKSGELDGAIVSVDSLEDAERVLDEYRPRLRDTGYLWLVT